MKDFRKSLQPSTLNSSKNKTILSFFFHRHVHEVSDLFLFKENPENVVLLGACALLY
jgi:hypothetical protein